MFRLGPTITLTRTLWHQGYLIGVHQDFVNYEVVLLDEDSPGVVGDDERLATNDVFPAGGVVYAVISKTHPCLSGNCLGYCPQQMVKRGDLYRHQAPSGHPSYALEDSFSLGLSG